MTGYLPGMEHEAHYAHLDEAGRREALSQWFTEPRLARRVWQWANKYEQARSVLEPSAGHGALVRPILEERYACTDVVLVEIDVRAQIVLEDLCTRARHLGMRWDFECVDFLERRHSEHALDLFDMALMNPPYEDGRAEEFILRALAVSSRVVGVFKASVQHGLSRFRMLWSRARVTREVKLAGRPSFGRGESGSRTAENDYVVLEIKKLEPHEDMAAERWTLVEHWA